MKVPFIILACFLMWLFAQKPHALEKEYDSIVFHEPSETEFEQDAEYTNSRNNGKSERNKKTDAIASSDESWNIYTLGEYNTEDVARAQRTIHEVFTFGSRVKGHQILPRNCLKEDNDVIDGFQCLSELQRSNERCIYITRQQIMHEDLSVRGLTRHFGNVVLLKSNPHFEKTLIHEIGHTYGLEHCNNKACVMAIYNDAEGTRMFCNRCIQGIPEGKLRDRDASTLPTPHTEDDNIIADNMNEAPIEQLIITEDE